jgi:hypothetical protein
VPHLVALSFELVARHNNNKGKDRIKLNGTFHHKDNNNEKDDNNNEKTTNEKTNPSCCMYFFNFWELMYVEDGKVILNIAHFLGNIFSSNFKNNRTFSSTQLSIFSLFFSSPPIWKRKLELKNFVIAYMEVWL